MIQISPPALKELQRLQTKQRILQPVVRLTLKPGGCSDWTYVVQFDNQYSSNDALFEYGDVRVAVARDIAPRLSGLNIDYAEDLMGGSFRFVNPNATQTCGCGLSFTEQSSQSEHKP